MATDDDDDGGSTSGVRSPRYPQISLKEAVAKAKAIYDKDKTAGSPLKAVYSHMGYKGKSGPSSSALGALKRFKLVENRDGRIHLTQRAIAILRLPETDDRRKAALLEAVMAPELYRSLLERYTESGLPSRASLEHEIVLDGRFNHNAIPGLVRDFYESLQFAGLTDEKGVLLTSGGSGLDDGDESQGDDEEDGEAAKAAPRKERKRMPGTKEDVFSLDEGQVVLTWPERLSRDSADDLKDWLELIGRKIDRAVAADGESGGDSGSSSGSR